MDIFLDEIRQLRHVCAAQPECETCPISAFCMDERYVPYIAKEMAWNEIIRICVEWLKEHPEEDMDQYTLGKLYRGDRCGRVLDKLVVSQYEMSDLEEITPDTTDGAYRVLRL